MIDRNILFCLKCIGFIAIELYYFLLDSIKVSEVWYQYIDDDLISTVMFIHSEKNISEMPYVIPGSGGMDHALVLCGHAPGWRPENYVIDKKYITL